MKKKHILVLREIQDSIPQELLLNITKKEKQYSTLKKVVEVALTKPDSEVSPKQKRRMQSLLDSGYLEREIEVINTPVEEQIAQYFEKEIARAVKEGRLPKKAPAMKYKVRSIKVNNMHDDNKQDSKPFSPREMKAYMKEIKEKTIRNLMHAELMSQFYRYLESKETSTELKGKTGLKASQLEDSAEHEAKFLEFLNTL